VTALRYWRLAWRARYILLGTTLSAVAIALVVTYFQARVYTAQASILAPKETTPQGGIGVLTALLGGGGGGSRDGGSSLPAFLGGGPTLSTNQDMFVAVLKSRTSRKEVIAELGKKYGADAGAKILGVDISIRDKGVIALSVDSTHPVLAAEAANVYFEVLDRTLDRLAQQATQRLEERYADQLQRSAKEVAEAEAAVLKFQAENRVAPIAASGRTGGESTSAPAAVDPNANLRGTIMSLELQREVLRMRMTDQHPQMRELDKQIAELKKQYSKNLFGAPMELPGDTPGQRRKEFFVSTEKLTPVQFAYLKLYRTLKIQEAFYTGALQGLEQLRYNEGVNRVRVDPLDPATPPHVPVRPRILLTLLLAAAGGLLIPIVVIDAIEYFRRVRTEESDLAPRAMVRDRRPERLASLTPPDDVLMPPDPFTIAGRGRQ
jgi:uncharacterized protein involved in exopolysaccharide biosynthesis